MRRSTQRRARNKAVSNNAQEASISWNGSFKVVDIATGHIDSVTGGDAFDFANEIDSELKDTVDEMVIHERGGDNIGYATVEDGEFVDFTIYGQYKR